MRDNPDLNIFQLYHLAACEKRDIRNRLKAEIYKSYKKYPHLKRAMLRNPNLNEIEW